MPDAVPDLVSGHPEFIPDVISSEVERSARYNYNQTPPAMHLSFHHNLKSQNTFGMDVSCACYAEYDSAEDLSGFFAEGKQFSLPQPFLHIGGGSNLLFTGDFPGTVFHSGIRFISVLPDDGASSDTNDTFLSGGGASGVRVEVGAGTVWDDFCKWCADEGLWGPENLSGIPGETGAAAVQNIGAYGVEFKDIVSEVRCFDAVTCSVKTLRKEDCGYGYRDSVFKKSAKGRYVVLSVIFGLSRKPEPKLEYGHVREAVLKALSVCSSEGLHKSGDAGAACGTDGNPTPLLIRSVITDIRNSKLPDPAVLGSAGSFFKNPVVPKSSYDKVKNYAESKYGADYRVPHFDAGSGFVKIPAAWLIEQCGWKGFREGNAGVYEHQPLVIVNATGKASPEEIIALKDRITASVANLFDIELVPEVEII